MKKLLILILFFVALRVSAVDYYISSTGTYHQYSELPTLVSGDKVYFNCGETFNGGFTVPTSVTLGSYGTGANPIISGFTTVTSWTNLGSNIWESTNTVSTLSTCEMVTINGVQAGMGRTPNDTGSNSDWYWLQSHSGTTTIASSNLTGTPDYSGATFVSKTTSYTLERVAIASQSGGTLTLSTGLLNQPMDNNGFFIQNSPLTLDVQNEWYYNPTTHKIRIYSISEPTNVKVASTDNVITINANNVTIDGLKIIGANKTGIYSSGLETYKTVQNCTISFCGENGTYIRGDHSIVYNCEISYCNHSGYSNVSAYRCIVRKCNVHDIGMILGSDPLYGGYGGIMLTGSATHASLVDSCSVVKIGFNGISAEGDSVIIKNNYVDNFNNYLSDGSGIYIYGASAVDPTQVIGNIILNGGATNLSNQGTSWSGLPVGETHGIYCDGVARNHVIRGNTISYVKNGINCAGIADMVIENNTIYDAFLCSIYIWGSTIDGNVNNTISHNIFVQKGTTYQYTANYNGHTEVARHAVKDYATFDYNIYARPIDDYNESYPYADQWPMIITLDGVKTYMTFSDFQTYSGQEVHGSMSPVAVQSTDSIRFAYNPTASDSIVTLDYPSIAIGGTTHYSSITLAPYTSAVLLPYANQSTPETPTSSGQIYRWKNMYFRNPKN